MAALCRARTLGEVRGRFPSAAEPTEDVDFTHQMKHGVPFVIALVLALAFVLLLLAFRSIVVPLKAIALNLLSVSAAMGAIVLLPSTMTLLGERNWYLPRFLERLPKAQIEAPPASTPH